MFKKLLALAMCFALLLSFVACGGSSSSKGGEDDKNDTSSTASSSAPTFEGTVDEQIGAWASYKKLIDDEPKDQGRTVEIKGRDESLVYTYTYTISFNDPATVFGNIEKSLSAQEKKFKEMHAELKASVPTVKSVIVEYYTKEGELALSKTFADGADVVTGGAYAPTQSSGDETTTGLYGKWETDYDISDAVVIVLENEFPEGTFNVTGVIAKYGMEFYEDGKCVATMVGSENFYNALIAEADKYLKSVYSDAAEAESKLNEFKANYTKGLVESEMNKSQEGTFTLTGDVASTGTIELSGDRMEGNMKFTVSGNTLKLETMANGEVLEDSALIFTRK